MTRRPAHWPRFDDTHIGVRLGGGWSSLWLIGLWLIDRRLIGRWLKNDRACAREETHKAEICKTYDRHSDRSCNNKLVNMLGVTTKPFCAPSHIR